VQDDEVYFTSSDGVQALAADTGKLLWHLAAANSNVGPALQIVGGMAYFTSGDAQRSVRALDARTGKVRWTLSDAPVEGGGLLLTLRRD
jgi:outer membrane protein assembly factor BamB